MRKILILVGKIEIIVATLCLSFVVFMIIVQVGLNNLFNSAIIWEQEAGRYALIWLTFIGASVGVKQMRHVTIISFVGYLPIKYRFLIRSIVYAITLWMFSVLIIELFMVFEIESRATTVTLPLDLPRSYFFSLPLIISSILIMLTTLLYFIEAIMIALGSEKNLKNISEKQPIL